MNQNTDDIRKPTDLPCVSHYITVLKRGGELCSVWHRPSDSPQKKTYLD